MTATFRPPAVFAPLAKSKQRYKLLFGGAGSAKSWTVAEHVCIAALTQRNHRILVVRKYAVTLRASCYEQIRQALRNVGLEGMAEFRYSPLCIRFPKNNSEVLFHGVDDPEKLKSIVGITKVWAEEATELTADDFDQVDLRMRGFTPYPKEFILTFNPTSTYHWIYRRWFIENVPGLKLHTTFLDNPYIDEAYKDVLLSKAAVNPAYHQVYMLGQWGTPEGRVYQPFEEADPPGVETIKETFYGLDFGFSNSYTAIVRIDVARDLWHVTEKLYERGLTTLDLAEKMRKLFMRGSNEIYADPSEPQQIQELWRMGFNIRPAHNKVVDGINSVIEKRNVLRTHGDNVNFNKEVALYCYKKDKSGNWLNDVVKQNDHLMDALRYAVFSHSHRSKGTSFG